MDWTKTNQTLFLYFVSGTTKLIFIYQRSTLNCSMNFDWWIKINLQKQYSELYLLNCSNSLFSQLETIRDRFQKLVFNFGAKGKVRVCIFSIPWQNWSFQTNKEDFSYENCRSPLKSLRKCISKCKSQIAINNQLIIYRNVMKRIHSHESVDFRTYNCF